MRHKSITIKIEADDSGLLLNAFADVLFGTVRILRGIDRSLSPNHNLSSVWQISKASMQSPLVLTLEPRAIQEDSIDVIGPFLDDMQRLENGESSKYMTSGLQQHAKKIVETYAKGIRSLTFSSNGTEVHATQRIAASVSESLNVETYEVGSIEGELDVISVHGGKDSIKVWDSRFGSPVICIVSDMQLEEAKQALGRRVVVRGRIRLQGSKPQTMLDVFDIRVMREDDDLPQPNSVGPIELFGDADPVDCLRGDV